MTITKIITGSIAALALAGAIAATPAYAGGYYRHSDAGAVAGAAIAGMAIGAMVGAATQPHNSGYYEGQGYYDNGYGYGYAPQDQSYYGGY